MARREMGETEGIQELLDSSGSSVLLAGRYCIYALFQVLLGSVPNEKRMQAAASVAKEAALGLFVDSETVNEFRALLSRATENMEDLQSEYTRLFIGPAVLPVAPWESVFLSGEQQLFTMKTLEIRNVYRESGFVPAGYPNVEDDHIAIEAGFLAALANRAQRAFEEGSLNVTQQALVASSQFLDNHVHAWIGDYVEALEGQKDMAYYPRIARLFWECTISDRSLLQRLIDVLV